jgi:hypothetical protein
MSAFTDTITAAAMVTTAPPASVPGVTMPPDLAALGWSLIPMRNHLYHAQHPIHGRTAAPTMLYGDAPDFSHMRRQIQDILDEVRGFSEYIPTAPATPAPPKKRTASERLAAVGQTIRDKAAAVGIMQTVVERLGNQHCTGRPWYRTTPNGKRYLYAIHPAGRPCPVCGSHPDEGARLRKMIAEEGSEEAIHHLQLMAAAKDYESAKAKLQRLAEQLQTIDRLIWQLEAATK